MKRRSIKRYLMEGPDARDLRSCFEAIEVEDDGEGGFAAYIGDPTSPDYIEWGDTAGDAVKRLENRLSDLYHNDELEITRQPQHTYWNPQQGHYEK